MSFCESNSNVRRRLESGHRDESVKRHEGQYGVVVFPPFFPAKTLECRCPKDDTTSRLFLVFCDLVYSFLFSTQIGAASF